MLPDAGLVQPVAEGVHAGAGPGEQRQQHRGNEHRADPHHDDEQDRDRAAR